jgi:hypothetical protein
MAERYGWINRAIPEAELDSFVANFVSRILSKARERGLGTAGEFELDLGHQVKNL